MIDRTNSSDAPQEGQKIHTTRDKLSRDAQSPLPLEMGKSLAENIADGRMINATGDGHGASGHEQVGTHDGHVGRHNGKHHGRHHELNLLSLTHHGRHSEDVVPRRPGDAPKVQVAYAGDQKSNRNPDFVINRDGTIVVHNNFETKPNSDGQIVISVDGTNDQSTPAEQKSLNQLLGYVNGRLKRDYPNSMQQPGQGNGLETTPVTCMNAGQQNSKDVTQRSLPSRIASELAGAAKIAEREAQSIFHKMSGDCSWAVQQAMSIVDHRNEHGQGNAWEFGNKLARSGNYQIIRDPNQVCVGDIGFRRWRNQPNGYGHTFIVTAIDGNKIIETSDHTTTFKPDNPRYDDTFFLRPI